MGGQTSQQCNILGDTLTPGQIIDLLANDNLSLVQAVILRQGSLADHTAGLLNGKGIQLAICPEFNSSADSAPVLVDGLRQQLLTGPAAELERMQSEASAAYSSLLQSSAPHELEWGGEHIGIHVDGKNAEELQQGMQLGAKGVGILRTEWLGWFEPSWPAAEAHYSLYLSCSDAIGGHELNIRLFDIGGDKIPVWAAPAAEQLASPLGYRGIRAAACLQGAFYNQITAICELAKTHPVNIVIPMVSDAGDVEFVRAYIRRRFGSDFIRRHLKIGSMIEVPSLALNLDTVTDNVDFFRIGPGDLTQFLLAKLRQDFSPEDLSGKAIHPASQAVIAEICRRCAISGHKLSICLDVEPRQSLLAQLLPLGLREFCVSPPNVPVIINRLGGMENAVE